VQLDYPTGQPRLCVPMVIDAGVTLSLHISHFITSAASAVQAAPGSAESEVSQRQRSRLSGYLAAVRQQLLTLQVGP
jgi:hypothetical protein